ncbi:MAG: glycosyltransferase family 8 protein [Planctomycetota bacterium]|nr:glycosyltransferase family 8 protein [Planctomycetota bacterium]
MSKPCSVAPAATPAAAERSSSLAAITEEIPVCLAADEYYAPYMAVCIQSIMENAGKNRRYHFYILHRELSAATIAALQQQVAPFPQFAITFIDVTAHIDGYNFFCSRHISVEAYFRLLIPYLLHAAEKALYLDSDTICRCDVAELFDLDLRDNYLAAVRDHAVSDYYRHYHGRDFKKLHAVLLSLKNPGDYFNSGMLILNARLVRETVSLPEMLALATSRQWQVHDQDVLNVFAAGKALLLPYRRNFMGYLRLLSDAQRRHLPEKLREEYAQAERDPQIVHYKFWADIGATPYSATVWRYAMKTPVLDVLLQRASAEGYCRPNLHIDGIRAIKHRYLGGRFLLEAVKAWLWRW